MCHEVVLYLGSKSVLEVHVLVPDPVNEEQQRTGLSWAGLSVHNQALILIIIKTAISKSGN